MARIQCYMEDIELSLINEYAKKNGTTRSRAGAQIIARFLRGEDNIEQHKDSFIKIISEQTELKETTRRNEAMLMGISQFVFGEKRLEDKKRFLQSLNVQNQILHCVYDQERSTISGESSEECLKKIKDLVLEAL